MYAYRRPALDIICRLPVGSLEQQERLEQLRWIENGYKIFTIETEIESFSVDTEQDLEKARVLAKTSEE